MEIVINNGIKTQYLKAKEFFGTFWMSLMFFGTSIVLLSLFRAGFSIWQYSRIAETDILRTVLINGLRVDISTVSYFILIPLILSGISYLFQRWIQITRWFVLSWYTTATCALVYLEVITPTFINEYDLRPNRLLIEYLIYPKEVLSMLWSGYKLEIAIATLSLFITVWGATRFFKSQWSPVCTTNTPTRILVAIFLLMLTVLGARSSLGHRPLNPALVSFSTDHLLNDLTLNSTYSLAFAIKQMQLENSSSEYYGDMPTDEILKIVKQHTNYPIAKFNNDALPTSTFKRASYQGKPKNLVILLQESLGARFVGSLGGLPLTPNLDTLMTQGWNFTNLYATGTRSVRGIEAVITGFTPTPSRSVVKLDKSQHQFFTIADLLKNNGYHTQFIYGGESHFDNMKSFFLGNGFEDIVDFENFNSVNFEGSWGASDEDLYNQAHQELTKLDKQDKPFFSLVFTSSNHSPFEYPDNKIVQYDSDKNTRNNAAKYSDFALGEFMKKAKQSAYWDNTIFLIVADHDSRVAGASLVPVEHFKIPGLILGEGIEPKNDSRLVSQIDLAPTLLSIMGVSDKNPMLGHDLTKELPKEKQRVMMQYDKNFAYMTPDAITILQPHLPPRAFEYVNKELNEISTTQAMIDQAKAHVLFGTLAYNNQWYQ